MIGDFMQIIEEQLLLNNEIFTKTEVKEIASCCTLSPDGQMYFLKKDPTFIRKNKSIQRALSLGLFFPNTCPKGEVSITASSEMKLAVERYR